MVSAARWHIQKILGISRITILEKYAGFFQQYGYRFAGKDETSAMVFIMLSGVHCVAVQIINLPRPMQEQLLEDLKLEASKRQRSLDHIIQ